MNWQVRQSDKPPFTQWRHECGAVIESEPRYEPPTHCPACGWQKVITWKPGRGYTQRGHSGGATKVKDRMMRGRA